MDKTGRIVLGATSAVFIALTAGLLAATVALGWLYGTQRDADGYVTSPSVTLSSEGYAISSADIDLESIPEDWVPTSLLGSFRVKAESDTGADVFIGVGPLDQVHAYLDDVEHSDVIRFGAWSHTTYVDHPGTRTPDLPDTEDFWTTTAEGRGLVSLDWQPESGAWALVVMNSNGSPGVDISTSVGIDTPWIPIGIWVTGFGAFVTGAIAAVLAVIALRRTPTVSTESSEEPELEPVSG